MEYCKIYRETDTIIVYIMKEWETESMGEHLEVRIEKDGDTDVFAEFSLPVYNCHHSYGFSDSDLIYFEKFLRNNALTIWEMWRDAKSIA
jgi:hypothetical protein